MKTQPGIFRGKMKFDKDFVMLPNDWLRDPNISYKAKGLLAYLYSHEPGYTIRFRQIISQTQDGERSIRAAMTELKDAGYLVTQRTTDSRGYNAGLNYLLVDPKDPELQNPTLDNPTLENPTLDNAVALEDNITKKTTNKENNNNEFDEFWKLYPRRIGKADAVKAWNRATKRKTADELLQLTRVYSNGKLPDETYIPYPASWLNKELYESVEVAEAKPLPKLFVGRIN
jgi:hypothetical protein